MFRTIATACTLIFVTVAPSAAQDTAPPARATSVPDGPVETRLRALRSLAVDEGDFSNALLQDRMRIRSELDGLGIRQADLENPAIDAAFFHDGDAWLIRDGVVIAYDLTARAPRPGYPKPFKEIWGGTINPDAAFVSPDGDVVEFHYDYFRGSAVSRYPTAGDGPNGRPLSNARTRDVYQGFRGANDAAIQLGSELLFFGNQTDLSDRIRPGRYTVVDRAQGRVTDLLYLEDRLPGVVGVDAAFHDTDRGRAYLFSGPLYWEIDTVANRYIVEGALIDDASWPGLVFDPETEVEAPVVADDLLGLWKDESGLHYELRRNAAGRMERRTFFVGGGIDILRGSQEDREARRAASWFLITDETPRAAVSGEGSSRVEFRLINPDAMDVRYNTGAEDRRFLKLSRKASFDADGIADLGGRSFDMAGHPALAMPAGTVEFSFEPRTASGPLFGADGRFGLSYDAEGLTTFDGRVDAPILVGEWHHVVLSSDGFTTRVLVNGAEVGTLQRGLDFGTEERVVFGRDGTDDFDGRMRNVRFWDAAIPAELLKQFETTTFASMDDVPTELRPFLIFQNDRAMADPGDWGGSLDGRTVYLVAQETVPFGARGLPRRAALTLADLTEDAAPYVARDAIGRPEQVFRVESVGARTGGWSRLTNVGTGVQVGVADAVRQVEYGTFFYPGRGTAQSYRSVVRGRHLAQGGTDDLNARQFRFLRQAIERDGRLEVAWLIQSRASAEGFATDRPGGSGPGADRVGGSPIGEVVALRQRELGAVFAHLPYEATTREARLFTVFPADATHLRPDPVSLSDWMGRRDELRTRRDAFAGKGLEDRGARPHFLPPVTNDETGRVTDLLHAFNRAYARLGGTGARPTEGRSFEEDYVSPVTALTTGALRGTAEARLDRFEWRRAVPEATDREFLLLGTYLTNRLNARAALERMVQENRDRAQEMAIAYLEERATVDRLFAVTRQEQTVTQQAKELGDAFGFGDATDALGVAEGVLGLVGADGGAGVLGWVGVAIYFVQLEMQLLDYALSQKEEDIVVTPYSDGSDLALAANRRISAALQAAKDYREAALKDMTVLPLYDPNLMEDIAAADPVGSDAASEVVEDTWKTVDAGFRIEFRTSLMQHLLPAHGAVVGVYHDLQLQQSWQLDSLVNAYALLEENESIIRSPAEALHILNDRDAIVAASQYRLNGRYSPFVWFLVKRPGSTNLRNFSPAVLEEARTMLDRRTFLQVMDGAFYVHGLHARASGSDDDWEYDEHWMEPENGGGGVWFPVDAPGARAEVEGSTIVGSGHADVAGTTFLHPEASALNRAPLLWYWPRVGGLRRADGVIIWRGEP